MSLERDPSIAAMSVEAHADLNSRLREFAVWAGVICSGCELSYAVASRALRSRSAYNCVGPMSPIRTDVGTVEEVAAKEQARQADASFSFTGNRCPLYQSCGDGYIMYNET